MELMNAFRVEKCDCSSFIIVLGRGKGPPQRITVVFEAVHLSGHIRTGVAIETNNMFTGIIRMKRQGLC